MRRTSRAVLGEACFAAHNTRARLCLAGTGLGHARARLCDTGAGLGLTRTGFRDTRRRHRSHLRSTRIRKRRARIKLDGIAEGVGLGLRAHVGQAHGIARRKGRSRARLLRLHVLFVIANHLRCSNRAIGRIKVQVLLHADKHVFLDADIRLDSGANAMAGILAVEEVVRHMHLAETHARHAFFHAVCPPGMVNRDVEMPAVRRLGLAISNQVAELVASRCRSIAELGPRNRDVVRSVGNIQVAIVTVVNIHVVDPHVRGFVIHLEAILVIIVVRTDALENQVADDDILRAAQFHGATRRGLRDNSTLVAIDGDVATDFNRAHVRARFHVDNLFTRLGVGLEVIYIAHRDFGIALAAGGAAILRGKPRHRKVRRRDRERRRRKRHTQGHTHSPASHVLFLHNNHNIHPFRKHSAHNPTGQMFSKFFSKIYSKSH